MKAVVASRYGSPDVLQYKEVAKPTPKEVEVLVKIHAASVAACDWKLLRADPFLVRLMFGLRKPKFEILGTDMAGRVEAVGPNVQHFEPGDEVFGELSESGLGAFAEYVCAPEKALATKPANLSYAETAALPVSGLSALQALRDKANIQPGQHVLINGASGGVGTYAIQIAKAFGAEVTAVASAQKAELVRTLGADHIIDYTQQDPTRTGQQYDVILDMAAYRSVLNYLRALKPKGIYIMVGGNFGQMAQTGLVAPWVALFTGKKYMTFLARPNSADLDTLRKLCEDGKLAPSIDRHFPLNQLADAIRHVEDRRVQGKVVIDIA